jgi:diguanylate cyclase (GGDEF)-like protein
MQNLEEQEHFRILFEYAPISLWEEDFSGIQRLFDGLRRQGVASLGGYLDGHPAFVDECIAQMRVIDINGKTLEMFKAESKAELLASLDKIFRDGMRHHFREELLTLWNGGLAWSGEGINYALDGDPVDIRLHWRILPGHETAWDCVLVSIEDITALKVAERARVESQKRFSNLFMHAPISLWEEDYREVKVFLDGLRAQGVTDLEGYLAIHPDAVSHCMGLIRVLDVNQKTLELFAASDRETLLASLDQIFRDEMRAHFASELVDMWNGKRRYEREGINYTLNGDLLNIHLDWTLMPGHEHDFGWVLVAIQDITARKKAEEYLRYLGTHDVMTSIYNRAYFEETILRLERERREPTSILIADLNGLKRVNDTFGHQAGDNLIRRAAEVLKTACENGYTAARIGGDEFAIIMPEADEQAAAEMQERIQTLVSLNNKYYRGPELSISTGVATSQPGLSLEKVISQADDAMYNRKHDFYQRAANDRRKTKPLPASPPPGRA